MASCKDKRSDPNFDHTKKTPPTDIDKTMFKGNTIARKELHSMTEAHEIDRALQTGLTRPRFAEPVWEVSWDAAAAVNCFDQMISLYFPVNQRCCRAIG